MADNVPFGDDHFDNAAADFARMLHLITPVTTAMLGHLPSLESGALVVDFACGTGEPGLTVARVMPQTQVLGIDAAKNMIAAARETARRKELRNIRFEAFSFDDMDIADETVNAVVSRFGALQFGDPAAVARQLARILKPRAAFSIAVWEDAAANTFFWLAAHALGRHVDGVLSAGEYLDRLAVPGRREQWLRESGIRHVNTEQFQWDYRFASADDAWAMVVSKAMLGTFAEGLDPAQLDDAREAFHDALDPFRTSKEAGYAITQTCRLIWGSK